VGDLRSSTRCPCIHRYVHLLPQGDFQETIESVPLVCPLGLPGITRGDRGSFDSADSRFLGGISPRPPCPGPAHVPCRCGFFHPPEVDCITALQAVIVRLERLGYLWRALAQRKAPRQRRRVPQFTELRGVQKSSDLRTPYAVQSGLLLPAFTQCFCGVRFPQQPLPAGLKQVRDQEVARRRSWLRRDHRRDLYANPHCSSQQAA